MTKRLTWLIAVGLAAIMALSGCGSSNDSKDGDDGVTASGLSKKDDASAQKVITDYLQAVFKKSTEVNENAVLMGQVSEDLKPFISEDTIKLSVGNPEIPLHYPRLVEMNGLLAVNYELTADTKEIDIKSIGKNNTDYYYFVKVNLYAKCISIDSLLAQMATQAPVSAEGVNNTKELNDKVIGEMRKKAYQLATKDVAADSTMDRIRLQLQYDFVIVKQGTGFKIKSAKESSQLDSYRDRLNFFNNSFASRVSYLNTEKNGSAYANKEQGQRYEAEKAVITNYFTGLCSTLNNDNMELLKSAWNQSSQNFKKLLDLIASTKNATAAKDDEKKETKPGFAELMVVDGLYKEKFPINSFPILNNIREFTGTVKISDVIVHPSYSEKQIKYIVSFDASIERVNGSVEGFDTKCHYEYFVTLAGKDKDIKVTSMRLKDHYYVDPKTPTADTNKESTKAGTK